MLWCCHLEILSAFEWRALHFHFAPSPATYVAVPGYPHFLEEDAEVQSGRHAQYNRSGCPWGSDRTAHCFWSRKRRPARIRRLCPNPTANTCLWPWMAPFTPLSLNYLICETGLSCLLLRATLRLQWHNNHISTFMHPPKAQQVKGASISDSSCAGAPVHASTYSQVFSEMI